MLRWAGSPSLYLVLGADPYASKLSAPAGENPRPFALVAAAYSVQHSPVPVQKRFLHDTGKQSVYKLNIQLIELIVLSGPTRILVTVPSDPTCTESVSVSIESLSIHALATPPTTEAILLSDVVEPNKSYRLGSGVSGRLYRPLLQGIHMY